MTLAPDTLDIPLTPPPGGQILHHTDRATVIWGDCRDPKVIAQVPDGYGLLCTDPPYGMGWQSSYGKNFAPIAGDDGTVDWPMVLREWTGPTGTESKLKDKRHIYVFGYRPDQLAEPLRLGGTAELIWDKANTGMGDLTQPWGPAHEVIAFGVHSKRASGRNGGAGRLAARLRQGSVLRAPRPNAGSVTRHPTEKPVALMAQLIESSTVRGDLVVDPCAGSGSTGVAAVLGGRRCFLVEYDRGYAELSVDRIKAAEKIAALMEAA
jgi:site-specific DNA-methyltransferase (adenine-specific)